MRLTSSIPLAVLLSGAALPARAELTVFEPALVDAVDRLYSAQGPTQITALRKLWSLWDSVDPVSLESELLRATQSPRLSGSAKAYARLLGAFARVRRGDLATARRDVLALGYVDRWIVVGPFDNEGKTGYDVPFGPELELAKGEPIVPGRAYSGKERPVRWRSVEPEAFPFGWLDLGALLRPQKSVCAIATTFIRNSQQDRGNDRVRAWVGTSGAFHMFLNGTEVLSDPVYRRHDVDRFGIDLRLGSGPNEITFKICGEERPLIVSLRLTDTNDQVDPHLQASNDPTLRTARVAAAPPSQTASAPSKTQRNKPFGPLLELSERASRKDASPQDLADYAEYLAATDGDDPTQHQARDLIQRAADQAPSVDRLLLAAELAEDRNQRRRFIERAEQTVEKRGTPEVRVALARAALERTGSSPQDAFAWYQQARGLDPDNIEATLGIAELQAALDLERTALATLETALTRHPRCIRLLGSYAERLRGLGRATEATEIEQRYANLRFDDGAWMGHAIDLALNRHDREAATWWAERAVAMSPAGPWSLLLAARTYRRVGDVQKALSTYERALVLAPEDIGTLRALADLQGEMGQRQPQRTLLRRVLEISPQDKATRDYLEHLEPQDARADERYAWASERFLPLRYAPAGGQNRRTLRQLTVTTVFPNGLSSTFRQVVFQPLTDAAAAMARQYAFPYESDRQIVLLRGARVYRENGSVDEAIESGEAAADDPSISMYTSARTFYVQFPRLEPRDVVELRYRVEDVTPRNEYADYFGDVVYLQSDEPVHNAEYVLVTPRSRRMLFDTNLGSRLVHSSQITKEQRIDRFLANSLPALEPEPAMPPFPEVAGFVHASTFDSWTSMGRWYWGFVRDQFDVDDETRRLAQRITQNKKTDLEKVQAIYGWVVENTRYVALELGVYGYKPHRAVQTVARGWGDCKDKATAIVTLLRTVGIDATLVILRTQLRGDFHSSIASLAPFDHAIAYVPSLDLYLDGTADGTGTRELPVMDRGALALRIHEGEPVLIRLPESGKVEDLVERRITVQLEASGAGQVDLDISVRGGPAPEWRHRYEAESTRRERLSAELAEEFSGLVIAPGPTAIQAAGLDDIERDVSLTVHARAEQVARREGPYLSLAVTPSLRLTPSLASQSRRKQDLRLLGPPRLSDVFEIRLPAGTRVVSAPNAISRSGPFGSYSLQVRETQGRVVVQTDLRLTGGRIHPGDYPAFQRFCAEVDSALGQRLLVGP